MSKEECPYCLEEKDDVCERSDLYAQEINEEEDATMYSCEECAYERAQDI